jgi:hypothetical protein
MVLKKNILAFTMLLLVAAPLFFILGHLVKREINFHEMMEKLETASLHTITIRLADVNWTKKNKELIVNGELFDVKYSQIIGDQVKLTGLFDREETKLEKDFASAMHPNNNQQAPITQLAMKFIFNFHFTLSQPADMRSFCQSTPVYPIFTEAPIMLAAPVNTPPPNL